MRVFGEEAQVSQDLAVRPADGDTGGKNDALVLYTQPSTAKARILAEIADYYRFVAGKHQVKQGIGPRNLPDWRAPRRFDPEPGLVGEGNHGRVDVEIVGGEAGDRVVGRLGRRVKNVERVEGRQARRFLPVRYFNGSHSGFGHHRSGAGVRP